MKRKFTGVIGVCISLWLLFPISAFANYNVYGPQPSDGIYLYYGKDDEPKTTPNGITLTVDETSVSYQSVKAVVQIPNTFIADREISRFYIVRNGQRIVDHFDPGFDNWVNADIVYYPLTIEVGDEYIGSVMEFQIVAVSYDSMQSANYVVGWSNISPPIDFKPLPVIDEDAISVLEQILAKLTELQASLEGKLANLQEAIENIYTPSPAAAQALDDAVDNFVEKLPMSEMSQEISNLNQSLETSKAALTSPDQTTIELGGRFRLIPELPESEVAFLDLTEYKDFIVTFRALMEAMLWVFFFQMLMNWLTPKPEI